MLVHDKTNQRIEIPIELYSPRNTAAKPLGKLFLASFPNLVFSEDSMNSSWQFFSVVFLLFAGLIGHPIVVAQSIDINNIPDEIRRCVHTQPTSELDSSINPFYISGDYDGDGVTDFAVLITSQRDHGHGIHHILFCFAHSKAVLWNSDSLSDAKSSPFTAWFLVRKQSKLLSVHPQIKHDSLAILIGDEGGGLIYWDGTKFRWQQEE